MNLKTIAIQSCVLTIGVLLGISFFMLSGNAFAGNILTRNTLTRGTVAESTFDENLTNGLTLTYQGSLAEGEAPANGVYDFTFSVYAEALGGVPLNDVPLELTGVEVSNGIFRVQLTFDHLLFTTTPRYLAIGVRPGGSSDSHTLLEPRQQITSSPFSIHAQSSHSASVLSTADGETVLSSGSNGRLTAGAQGLPLVRIVRLENLQNNVSAHVGVGAQDYDCVASSWSARFDILEEFDSANPDWFDYMIWTYVSGADWKVSIKFPSGVDEEMPDVDILCFHKSMVSWEGASRGLWDPD